MDPSPIPSNPLPDRCLAVVPAAGIGARVGADRPKQYLEIAGRTLLEWSVGALLSASFIDAVLVVVAPGDERAGGLVGRWPRVRVLPVGGATRRDSVLAGLEHAGPAWRDQDWALVHDAARPGLTAAALARLRDELFDDEVGGLLVEAVSDTVKRGDGGGRVATTLARDGLWLAQTPQMFRLGLLRDALQRHAGVTDEAAAIEAQGLRPRLVAGERGNFKVTTPQDLRLMAAWLGQGADRPAGPRAG